MFCTKCGSYTAGDAAFCTHCGTPLRQEAQRVPQTAPQPTPQFVPPYNPQYVPVNPGWQSPQVAMNRYVSKKVFLAEHATPETRHNGNMALIAMVVALVLILVSICLPIFGELSQIPAVILVDADSDLTDIQKELEEICEEGRDELRYNRDVYSSSERKAVEGLLDALEAVADNFSLANMVRLTGTMDKDLPDYFYYSSGADDLEEAQFVFWLAIGTVAALFFLPLLFTLLGGLLKRTGLVIAALILLILPQALLSGFVLVGLSLVCNILLAVLCSRVNRDYNRFQSGTYQTA